MNSDMSIRKLADRIGYTRDWVEAIIASGKKANPSVGRMIGFNLTECFVSDVCKLPRSDREEMWRRWYAEVLPFVCRKELFPAWTKFVSRVCLMFRFKCIACLLCALPHRLKLAGLHR